MLSMVLPGGMRYEALVHSCLSPVSIHFDRHCVPEKRQLQWVEAVDGIVHLVDSRLSHLGPHAGRGRR